MPSDEDLRHAEEIMEETSITSALRVAETLQKPYVQGFVKNRYIFRYVQARGIRWIGFYCETANEPD